MIEPDGAEPVLVTSALGPAIDDGIRNLADRYIMSGCPIRIRMRADAVATGGGVDVLGDRDLPSYGELVAHPAAQRANSHGTEHVIGKEAIP